MHRIFFAFVLIILNLSTKAEVTVDSSKAFSQQPTFRDQLRADSLFSLKSQSGIIPFFLHNMRDQAVSPFHMNKKQMITTAGVIVITATLIHFDEDIDKVFRPLKDKNKFLREFTPYFTDLGDYYGYALLAGFGGISLLTHQYRPFHTSVLAAHAAVTAGIWVRAGKIVTGRMRPGATYNDIEYNHDHWFGPFAQFNSKYNENRGVPAFDAFPSGHTAAAFAIATIFAKEYSDKKAVPIISYGLASLVAVSRLVQHDHWASDLLPGAMLGYLCANQVFQSDKRIKMNRSKGQLNFFPSYGQFPMLTVQYNPN